MQSWPTLDSHAASALPQWKPRDGSCSALSGCQSGGAGERTKERTYERTDENGSLTSQPSLSFDLPTSDVEQRTVEPSRESLQPSHSLDFTLGRPTSERVEDARATRRSPG